MNSVARLGEHIAVLQKAFVKVSPVRASSASFGISSASQPGPRGQWRGLALLVGDQQQDVGRASLAL